LKESFSTISDFSSNVAHELRTPLTILMGNLEVGLRRTREKEEYQIIINDAITTVKDMQHLIEDMLLMLRPATAYSKNDFEQSELGEILREVTEQFEAFAASRNIKLDTHISPELRISCIPSLIRRIFINLIDNAVKYSPENTTVTIRLEKCDGKIEFTVSDEGAGIPEEDIYRIFDRFFRGKNNSNSHGLGLAMTKQLAAVHNAEISVKNNPGKGACFKITFPLKP